MRRILVLSVMVGCKGGDEAPVEDPTPRCDGILQDLEITVDAPFDLDEDGFFDADNPDCAATYFNSIDCDDTDPLVNPAAPEVTCNGVDDDCQPASEENPDRDGDGFGVCDECNDGTDVVYPGADEICFDGRDNDCDGIEDNDCGLNYNGTWQLDTTVQFGCDLFDQPIIAVDFDRLLVTWLPPFLTISPASGGPTAMDGTVLEDGSFALSLTVGLAIECQENYVLEGTFTSENTMEGFFSVDLNQGFPLVCLSCPLEPESWTFTATRIP